MLCIIFFNRLRFFFERIFPAVNENHGGVKPKQLDDTKEF